MYDGDGRISGFIDKSAAKVYFTPGVAQSFGSFSQYEISPRDAKDSVKRKLPSLDWTYL